MKQLLMTSNERKNNQETNYCVVIYKELLLQILIFL
jgi:hypothetical protein